jgi:uncharacterized membrane protein
MSAHNMQLAQLNICTAQHIIAQLAYLQVTTYTLSAVVAE